MGVVTARGCLADPHPIHSAEKLSALPPAATTRMSSGEGKGWRHLLSSPGLTGPGRAPGALDVRDLPLGPLVQVFTYLGLAPAVFAQGYAMLANNTPSFRRRRKATPT